MCSIIDMNTSTIASLPSDFDAFRDKRNPELQQKFSRTFDGLVGKYATLHKNVMYKKISKVSFITKQTNTNSILSVLNKLTNWNAKSLSDKIMARCNESNVADLVEQTLEYASNSTIHSSILETLLVGFVREYPDNGEILEKIQMYVVHFLENFDQCKNTQQHENYGAFLDRTVANNRVKGTARMVTTICVSSELSRLYDKDVVFLLDQIVDKIDIAISQEVDDNLKGLLMECMLIIIQDRLVQSKMSTCIVRFRNCRFDLRLDLLSNKHRFQMYDIFETMEKIEQKNKRR